jgi:hypothetical protein
MFAELQRLGFRRPSQAYLDHWRKQLGYGPRLSELPNVGAGHRKGSTSEPVRKGAQTSYKVG